MTKTGLEVLLSESDRLLKDRRVGVIANPSSVGPALQHIVDLLHSLCKGRLAAVFGPQHGARGETQDNMIEWEDYRDSRTGLPVYSLYGKTRKPTPAMLRQPGCSCIRCPGCRLPLLHVRLYDGVGDGGLPGK